MKWLLIIVVAIAAIYYLTLRSDKHSVPPSGVGTINAIGFVTMPENSVSMDKVIVLSSPNCPSDQAQRANDIADYLTRKNIPFVRTSNINFTLNHESEMKTINTIMAGKKQPVVIVKGKAKGNPEFSEILEAYQSN